MKRDIIQCDSNKADFMEVVSSMRDVYIAIEMDGEKCSVLFERQNIERLIKILQNTLEEME